MIERLREAGLNFDSLRVITDDRFAGKTFVLTGALSKFTREEATDKIELFGGKASQARTYNQEFVKNVFLICSYTGLRVGDATNLTSENVVGDSLHYVAQKTHKPGAIPLKPCVAERIKWLSEHQDAKCSRTYYNRAIKRLCKKAGLTDDVVVLKGGKERRGPKWMFVSSHTARISTATCLDRRGVAIGDICQLLQHSSVTTTERYIVRDHIELSEEAMKFFE